MKKHFPFGLLVVFVLCIAGSALSAQSYVVENDLAEASANVSPSSNHVTTNVDYTGIGLSAPWIYAGETFKISLTVQNLGAVATTHQVQLYQLVDPGTGKRILQQERSVQLAPGAKEAIELDLIPEELVASGEPLEELLVFFLGKYEIGLECEW
ncbi:MAG: hypothetical protein AAGF89_10750 [Bacteroidota bacterium]